MRPRASLCDLAPVRERAVIINCGTKWFTSLALASTLRHARCHVVVIDCESNDGSRAHFERLGEAGLAFDWIEWPLRRHPAALDVLFRELRDERVLLVDSDAEIRDRRVIDAMRSALEADPRAYGAGFAHGPCWMGGEHGLPPSTGYYARRMWIPCVMLRVACVRDALVAGASFADRRAFTPLRHAKRKVHWVVWRAKRWKPRGASSPTLVAPAPAEGPARDAVFVEYDTGADLHAVLVDRGASFAALSEALWGDVHHVHGVTRATLVGRLRRIASHLRLAERGGSAVDPAAGQQSRMRLAGEYGVDVASLER